MELRDLRDRAVEAFTKGRFARAGELYEAYCAKDPRDLQARLRMGDAWSRAGQKPKAVAAYHSAATAFAAEGLLARAIAAGKLILEVEPSHPGVQRLLADLYARRSTGPSRASRPSDPAAIGTPVTAEPAPELELEIELGDAPAEDGLPLELDPTLQAMPVARNEVVASRSPPGLHEEDFAGFDELSLEDAPDGAQSLLHAVERAAQRGAEGRAETFEIVGSHEEEEDFFSLTAELELTAPAPGPDAAALLPRLPLFGDLSKDAFVGLFERSPLRQFGEGDPILRQGSTGDAFYVVCEGAVRVVREGEGEAAQDLAVLKEGAFFGEMALLSGAPRSASVYSASPDTKVLEISAPVLAELSRDYPSVAEALRTFCRQRLLSNVMATSPLFAPFGRSDRRALIEKFRAREAPRAQVIVREGQESDGLYAVLAGEVEVTRGGTVLARLREGELFGEMSLLRKAPATATVTTTRRTSLLRLPREDFDLLVLTHPQILVLVSELTDDRERQTDALLGGAVRHTAEGLLLV